MITHKDHFHGSDLEKIEAIYGIKKEDIISFSANVNPLGISPRLSSELSQNLGCITSYPDREYKSLRAAMASYVGTDVENIMVGNGSTELISLFIQTRHPKKAMILGPTYSEYEREVTLGGGTTLYYPLKESLGFNLDVANFITKLGDDIDLLVLCNPNNPTGSCIGPTDMRIILDVCKEHDIFVMVDETYIEFVEDVAATSAVFLTAYYNNIIILRGTSKFFAAPGLRLGYAITGNRDLLAAMSKHQNPWTISSLAVIAGEIMFSDAEYIEATRSLIASERSRLFKLFDESKRFKAYKPTANFMLLRIAESGLTSGDLFDGAIRQGMMIRDCSTFPFLGNDFIRFCFMSREDNDRLAEFLLG